MNVAFGTCTNEVTNLLAMDHDSGYVEGCVSSEALSNQDESSESSAHSIGIPKVPEPPFIISEDALLETPQLGDIDSVFTHTIDNEDYSETRRQFFTPDKIINSSVTTEKSNMGLDGLESENSSIKSTEIPTAKPLTVTLANLDSSLIDYNHEVQDTDLSINHTLSDMSLEHSTYEPIIFEHVSSQIITNTESTTTNNSVKTSGIENETSGLENSENNESNVEVNQNSKKNGTPIIKNQQSTNVNMAIISQKNMENKTSDIKSTQFNKNNAKISLNVEINGIPILGNKQSTDVNMTGISETELSPIISPRVQVYETDCLKKTEILQGSPILPNTKRIVKEDFIHNKDKENFKISMDISNCLDNLDNSLLQTEKSKSELNVDSKFIFESPLTIKNPENVENSEKPKSNFIFESPKGVLDKAKNALSPKKRRLTLVFSKAEKENYIVKRKYPSMTPEKKIPPPIDPNISPDLFSDDNLENSGSTCFTDEVSNMQVDPVIIPDNIPLAKGISRKPQLFSPNKTKNNERYTNSLDRRLLSRLQKGLSGILPPPSMINVRLSVIEILDKLEENKSFFWDSEVEPSDNLDDTKDNSFNSSEGDSSLISKSLLVNTDDLQGLKGGIEFPEILEQRYHGVHYNHSKISEEIANLCDKYAKRFVGGETQSSCTVFEQPCAGSPSKRKTAKSKFGAKSPGRRLSHLARRRITFSSANLQAGGSSLAGSRARQILVDARKMELLNHRKSPKKTPKKSPRVKTRTPSSSAKKKLALRFRKVTGEIENSLPSSSEGSLSSKRALFKSPDKSAKSKMSGLSSRWSAVSLRSSPSLRRSLSSTSDSFSSDSERSHLRRALFTSPRKDSPSKNRKSPVKKIFGAKRKRLESDDEQYPTKMARSVSCLEVQATSSNISNKAISRTRSEVDFSNRNQMDLNDLQKKKLQWAVYEALKTQNIQPGHPQFKVLAAILARVTRSFFSNLMSNSSSIGSTTDRMLRIAKHHVFAVIKGKTSDEIINEALKARARLQKPQGYVAPVSVAPLEEVNNARNKETIRATSGSKPGVLQDCANTIESWEKKKLEQLSKPTNDSKLERIRKVINFGDDR